MGRWKKNKNKKPQQKRQRNNETDNPDGEPVGEANHGAGSSRVDGNKFVSQVVERGNFKMESYYAAQGLHHWYWNDTTNELVKCQTDEEINQERLRWREAIGEVLPSSFRVGRDMPEQLREKVEAQLEQLLASCLPHSEEAEGDSSPGELEQLVKKLAFLPDAYQLGLARNKIRKHDDFQKLHHWLKNHTESGFISRQETVSMIPPVVLLSPHLGPHGTGVLPNHHRILDMCAAPGSKTAQLLEQLYHDHHDNQFGSGALVANDANWQRAHMLVHQLRRILHHNPVAIVTNCEAQFFPNVLQFDSILADVPCTGDGTSRKNIGVWKKWSQMASLGLHALQLDIAWKGAASLTKVGGHLCYSTCSFNPVENEAVVAELLRRSNGALELVEVHLEGFKTRPGLSTWKVFCEEKSRREMNNDRKKNSSKMKQRRKEWQQKGEKGKGDEQARLEEGNAAVDDDNASPSNDKIKESKAEEAKEDANESSQIEAADDVMDHVGNNSDDSDDGDAELKADSERTFRKFEPTDFSDETLIEMLKSSGLNYYASFADVPEKMFRRIRKTCFPPSEEEVNNFHLERCIRCLPQDNDTGGFFVALLRKVGPVSAKDRREANAAAAVEGDEAQAAAHVPASPKEPESKRPKVEDEDAEDLGMHDVDESNNIQEEEESHKPVTRGRGMRVKGNLIRDKDGKENAEGLGRDDFVPVSDEILDPLVEFYGLDSSPTFRKDLYMTRAGGDAKIIYYIAKPVKDLIDLGLQKRVTVVNTGLKGFHRSSNHNKGSDVSYRICQEGAHFLAPHMSKRKVALDREDFIKFLKGGIITFDDLSDSFRDAVKPMSIGSLVVMLKGYEEKYSQKMILTLWRGRGEKFEILVAKTELDAIRIKLEAIDEIENSV